MTNDNDKNLKANDQNQIESLWIKCIQTGDESSFEKLFNFYCQRLINFARRYVVDVQIAENIVQDVFVHLWHNRTNLNPSKNIKSYLFTSVKNGALKEIRHTNVQSKSNERILDKMNLVIDPEKELATEEIERNINLAIKELPDKCREIFMMNRFDGLKYAEIAEIQNISVKTVEVQMGRALKKLRMRLKPFLPFILFVILILIILFSLG